MEIVKNILVAIYLVVCLVMIVLVLKQSKEDNYQKHLTMLNYH